MSLQRFVFILSLFVSLPTWANCNADLLGESKEYVRLVTLAVQQAPDERATANIFKAVATAPKPLNPIQLFATTKMLLISQALDRVWPSLGASEWASVQAEIAKLESRVADEKVDSDDKVIETARLIRIPQPLPNEQPEDATDTPAYFRDSHDAIMAVHNNSLKIFRLDMQTGLRTQIADLQIYQGSGEPSIFRDQNGLYVLTKNINDVVHIVKVDGASAKSVAHRTVPSVYRVEHVGLSDGRNLIFAQSPHPDVPKYMSIVQTFEFDSKRRALLPKGKDEMVGSGAFEIYGENETDIHFSIVRDDGYLTYFDIAKETLKFRKEMSASEVVGHFHYMTSASGERYGLLKTQYGIKSVKLDSSGRPLIAPLKKDGTKSYWEIDDFVTTRFAGRDWVIDWKGRSLVVSEVTKKKALKVASRTEIEGTNEFFRLSKPFLTKEGRVFFFFYGSPSATLYELLNDGKLVTRATISSGYSSEPFLIENSHGQIFIYTHVRGRLQTMTLFHDLTR